MFVFLYEIQKSHYRVRHISFLHFILISVHQISKIRNLFINRFFKIREVHAIRLHPCSSVLRTSGCIQSQVEKYLNFRLESIFYFIWSGFARGPVQKWIRIQLMNINFASFFNQLKLKKFFSRCFSWYFAMSIRIRGPGYFEETD